MGGAWIKRIMDRFGGRRWFLAAVYGMLFLLALLFYGIGDGWFVAAPRDGPVKAETTLESRLEDILSTVRGAGRVRVLITYSTAGERVAATVSTTDESVSETSGGTAATHSQQSRQMRQPATITTEGGQSPIILVEKEPEIRGVLVVAEGAADPTVRLSLQRAVQAVTGVSLSCIEVFEMNYLS